MDTKTGSESNNIFHTTENYKGHVEFHNFSGDYLERVYATFLYAERVGFGWGDWFDYFLRAFERQLGIPFDKRVKERKRIMKKHNFSFLFRK